VGKPKQKRPLVQSVHSWGDNIKIDIHDVGSGLGMVNVVMNLWVA
jgi:hypothetical protein